MNRYKRAAYIAVVLFLLVGLDHATKWTAIHCLRESGQTYIFPGDIFRLQYAENTGAFLSLGAGLPSAMRSLIMTGLNTVILGGLLCYLFASKTMSFLPGVALTLIAGGGVGNLIDRFFRDGRVVDFMNMGVTIGKFSLRTGIFNIADVAIMAGLFLIILHEIMNIRKGEDTNKK